MKKGHWPSGLNRFRSAGMNFKTKTMTFIFSNNVEYVMSKLTTIESSKYKLTFETT